MGSESGRLIVLCRPSGSSPTNETLNDKPEPLSGKEKAEKAKDQGNLAFKGGRYQEAVDLYTEAIGSFLSFIS